MVISISLVYFPCAWVACPCSLMNHLLFKKKEGFERENHVMMELLFASPHPMMRKKKFQGPSLLVVSFAFKNVFSSYFILSYFILRYLTSVLLQG